VVEGTVEELFWIGFWTIVAVGLAGVAAAVLEWLSGRRR